MRAWALLLLAACGAPSGDVVIDLRGQLEVEVRATFEAPAHVTIIGGEGHLVEAWADGPGLPVPASEDASWEPPTPAHSDVELDLTGTGTVRMRAWSRGDILPPVSRDRSLAWFDDATLSNVSFARVMNVIGGGPRLEQWFMAFAAGPGAGRATFAQFLDEVRAAQGVDASTWDLTKLPFKVTGVHNRIDLGGCGELRVSVASTHPTFAPVHLIFLFKQPPGPDDKTPDGLVHCRATARRWARLSTLDEAAFRAAAAQILDEGLVKENFSLAESVELSISPWQWRQWVFNTEISNPVMFQTIDVARVNTPGPTRDAFLADLAANREAILARRWFVPVTYRSTVAEVQPNSKAPLPDAPADLVRPLAMIGCPRCHTENADFIQTSVERKPSPFYDKELDARAARLDGIMRGETPAPAPFGPLQSD
jgi:hypothetical protein